MPETNKPDDSPDNAANNHNRPSNTKLRWIALGGGTLFTVLVLVSIFVPNMAERIKFFTGNFLNLLILCVVLVQALIYHEQWKTMDRQVRIMGIAIEPRLRVTNVKVKDFKAGKLPVFIVSIINEGATDAKDVTLDIRVNLEEEDAFVIRWSNPQIVTIPAGQERHYFVPWRTSLPQERIDSFNKSVPLKVSGFFKLKETEQKDFCYRYYPWEGKRPKGVSQFVPCDFNPGLTIAMKAEPGIFNLTGGCVSMTVTKAVQQKQEDSGSANPKELTKPKTP